MYNVHIISSFLLQTYLRPPLKITLLRPLRGNLWSARKIDLVPSCAFIAQNILNECTKNGPNSYIVLSNPAVHHLLAITREVQKIFSAFQSDNNFRT